MASSTEDGRITKTNSTTKTSRPKRTTQHQSKSRALPLVERTNNLSLTDFITNYVSPEQPELEGQKGQNKSYELGIYTASSIPENDLEACFRLIELTSKSDYSASSMGWSPASKRSEMRLPDMRYLILREKRPCDEGQGQGEDDDGAGSGILGFLSFMVTYEDGKEVIYCYEIHLSPAARGQGLGKVLMTQLEDVGRRVGLEKAMLTVFKVNEKAIRFYEKLGYTVDEFSPAPRKLRNGAIKEFDYLILSKLLT